MVPNMFKTCGIIRSNQVFSISSFPLVISREKENFWDVAKDPSLV